jgi:SAM-dependent methyltransferase
MIERDLVHFYDELYDWSENNSEFQSYSGFQTDAIHRFLTDPRTGVHAPDTLYSFMDPHIEPVAVVRGLDAGCGYGGACFHFSRTHGGQWLGVTISPKQVAHARRLIEARGFFRSVDVRLMSYDDDLPGPFDVGIAIESLIHSADPARTIRNLSSALKPGGRLILVDDMPRSLIPTDLEETLAAFKAAWRCPVAPSEALWRSLAADAGLRLIARQDLSPNMRPRHGEALETAFKALMTQFGDKVANGFSRLSDAEIGGLHLERLHAGGAVDYMMLVFEKA